jgi:glyoxylase-like metal-dependent hydrolase (beta-lactamase superfamily II)
MSQEIRTIRLPFPFGMGRVNCYLLKGEAGFVLVDTGSSSNRKALAAELQAAGCQSGQLNLIILTHGDYDHTGNAVYLRQNLGGKIAMHPDDAGMLEQGDMFFNRKKPNAVLAALLPIFGGFGKAERGKPDVLLREGDNLAGYGLDARVISIPGHSKGSIGILLASGDLFCGDLLVSTKSPGLNSLIDDMPAAQASLQKLSGMQIGRVYPGHGDPFELQQILEVSG